METQTKAFYDNQMGWCITDSNRRTSPCTYREAAWIKLGWNFTDIQGVLVRDNKFIDLELPLIRGVPQELEVFN